MTNKEAIECLRCNFNNMESCDKEECNQHEAIATAIELLEKQERLEAITNDDKVVDYLRECDKDTLIELYLQTRFERDIYVGLYEDKCSRCMHKHHCDWRE